MEFLYCSRYQVHKLSGDKLPESLKRSGTFPTVLEPWMENISRSSRPMKAPSISNILDITVSFSWLSWMPTTESFTLMLVPMAELVIQDFFATLDYIKDWKRKPGHPWSHTSARKTWPCTILFGWRWCFWVEILPYAAIALSENRHRPWQKWWRRWDWETKVS